MNADQRAKFEEWWCGHGQYTEPWTCRDVAEAAWRVCCCCHANAIDQPADDERERLRDLLRRCLAHVEQYDNLRTEIEAALGTREDGG